MSSVWVRSACTGAEDWIARSRVETVHIVRDGSDAGRGLSRGEFGNGGAYAAWRLDRVR